MKLFQIFFPVLLALMVTGCKSGSHQIYTSQINSAVQIDHRASKYGNIIVRRTDGITGVVKAGNALAISFPKSPELNTIVTVDINGNIFVQPFGSVKVAGEIIQNIRSSLDRVYEAFYSDKKRKYFIQSNDKLEILFESYPQLNEKVTVRPDGMITLPVIGSEIARGKTPSQLGGELSTLYSGIKGEYTIRSNDLLEVRFSSHPKLNEVQTVRPDGMITLPMVGSIVARGKVASQLKNQLQMLYSEYLKNPKLVVIVRKASPKRILEYLNHPKVGVVVRKSSPQQIFIGGEVTRPGVFQLRDKMTAIGAIVEAGGDKVTGNMKQVVIIRKLSESEPVILVQNLESGHLGDSNSAQYLYRAIENNITLQPNDLIIVPKTRIAVFNEYLNEYLYNVLPTLRNSPFSFVYNIGVTRIK